ncbi:MAG: hypothetical protein LKF01_00115 [Lactobacillus sp.]|jgi:hypothetical protein|nr:hypothetical protein [Lactobacillus sp.]MCH4067947.1 hypothetical protein [Lactobacillus sp.]MCI1303614.1 hypothetical protein [Lactobacillus sp.]MCI1329877.1 hypothetical protein [Lactobacillus sp.]MCI1359553.1 hypothetical protein [Lactobacillus sp.]
MTLLINSKEPSAIFYQGKTVQYIVRGNFIVWAAQYTPGTKFVGSQNSKNLRGFTFDIDTRRVPADAKFKLLITDAYGSAESTSLITAEQLLRSYEPNDVNVLTDVYFPNGRREYWIGNKAIIDNAIVGYLQQITLEMQKQIQRPTRALFSCPEKG